MLKIVPIRLEDANRFVDQHHRHNKRATGHKFSIGLERNGEFVGVAIVGRPVARMLDNGRIAEVLRVCVRGRQKNASSKLYARAKRIAQLMGYERVVTYTLTSKGGSSLKAIDAEPAEASPRGEWDRPSRRRRTQAVYGQEKIRWELLARDAAFRSPGEARSVEVTP